MSFWSFTFSVTKAKNSHCDYYCVYAIKSLGQSDPTKAETEKDTIWTGPFDPWTAGLLDYFPPVFSNIIAARLNKIYIYIYFKNLLEINDFRSYDQHLLLQVCSVAVKEVRWTWSSCHKYSEKYLKTEYSSWKWQQITNYGSKNLAT